MGDRPSSLVRNRQQTALPQEQLFDTHAEVSLDFEIVRQAARQKYTRPFLIIDTAIVREKLRRFRAAMPRVRPHYAVKANPDRRVLKALVQEGAGFEIASTAELDLLISLGVNAGEVFFSNPMRARARDKIMPVVTAKFSAETFESLVAKLERLKIPFGPLAKPGDLFEDRHLNEGGRMLDVLLPTGTRAKLPGIPLDMGGRKPRVRRQPPVMGADTRAVLAEAGYTAAQINDLVERRVVIAAE